MRGVDEKGGQKKGAQEKASKRMPPKAREINLKRGKGFDMAKKKKIHRMGKT